MAKKRFEKTLVIGVTEGMHKYLESLAGATQSTMSEVVRQSVKDLMKKNPLSKMSENDDWEGDENVDLDDWEGDGDELD